MSQFKAVKLLISLFTLAVTAFLVQAPVNARNVTHYEAWKLGLPCGYREKVKGPNPWYVRGDSTSSTAPNFAVAMVLHRMAIRAKASGFSHFSIVNFEINNRQIYAGAASGQDVYLTAVGVNDPAMSALCEAKPRWKENCKTLSVDETLAMHGPLLGQTPAIQAEELARLKAAGAT